MFRQNYDMDAYFTETCALVTGVGKGVGQAIVVKLAELGAKVYGCSRTQSDLDALVKEIRVNSVNPTILMTELGKRGWSDPVKKANAIKNIPTGRLAEEEDVVNATAFLFSDKSSMINVVILPVDGGMIVSCV